MVQYAGRLDHVELSRDRFDFEDVSLRIVDIAHVQFAGLTFGVAQAGEAEIDGKHARAAETLRALDRMVACAAASDENVAAVLADDALQCGCGKQYTHGFLDAAWHQLAR